MTIFVGGPRHGDEYHAEPAHVGSPPFSYVDPATGELYLLLPVVQRVPNPITGQPWYTLECIVYLHGALSRDQQSAQMALQDAVTRWWFTTHGTRNELSTPDANGNHAATGDANNGRNGASHIQERQEGL